VLAAPGALIPVAAERLDSEAADGSWSKGGGSGFGTNIVFLTSRRPRILLPRRLIPEVCAC
jgi:hypothetical protein